MTIEMLEQTIQDTINWIEPTLKDRLRPDLALHISEAVFQAYSRESGDEATHHAAGRYWNASSSQYDEYGCW